MKNVSGRFESATPTKPWKSWMLSLDQSFEREKKRGRNLNQYFSFSSKHDLGVKVRKRETEYVYERERDRERGQTDRQIKREREIVVNESKPYTL